MAHRIRETWRIAQTPFSGPEEVDETFMGAKEKNKLNTKKLHAGRGTVGKAIVVGMKDRETGMVSASTVSSTDKPTLTGFVSDRIDPGLKVYTDELASYNDLPYHEVVKHNVSEYVRDQAHTNAIESLLGNAKA